MGIARRLCEQPGKTIVFALGGGEAAEDGGLSDLYYSKDFRRITFCEVYMII
jgi:hypothetical protein